MFLLLSACIDLYAVRSSSPQASSEMVRIRVSVGYEEIGWENVGEPMTFSTIRFFIRWLSSGIYG
jgi:hypothetical protein